MRQQQKEPDILLVDIRPARDFSRCHIKGSINIAPHEISGRQFLKNKNTVLIYGGINHPAALRLAEKIKDQNLFPVSILEGGICAWADQGLPLQERQGSREELYSLDALEVYQLVSSKKLSDTVLLDTRTPRAFNRNAVSGSINFPFVFSAENLNRKGTEAAEYLQKINRKNKKKIILISQAGISGRLLADFREKYKLRNLFFLHGGMDEYTRYLKQMKSVTAGRKKLGRSRQPECR